ncbi:myb-like protein H [Ochlerotatus camptorhynchus]|uniref:myb-like protein H n=1 Tax=Ochlerotatus camptorhynchus TaxID=644619 RepID=UPI0031CE37DA
MKKSVNSLSPISPLPNTPPPVRTSPVGSTSPKLSPAGSVFLSNSASRPTLSINNSSNRCSSLLDADDITPITSPLPNILCPQEIYTIFSRTDDPDAGSTNLPAESSRLSANNHRNSIFLANANIANGNNNPSASSKSRSRRSSELSQNIRSDRSASASMKSHSSSAGRKRSSTHIEMNANLERPRCLKSSFLRRKCKEYAGELRLTGDVCRLIQKGECK